MSAGKLDAAGMALLAADPGARQIEDELRIAEYRQAVLLDCLGDAMRAIAWYSDPEGRVVLRRIRSRLCEAGLGERAEVRS